MFRNFDVAFDKISGPKVAFGVFAGVHMPVRAQHLRRQVQHLLSHAQPEEVEAGQVHHRQLLPGESQKK